MNDIGVRVVHHVITDNAGQSGAKRACAQNARAIKQVGSGAQARQLLRPGNRLEIFFPLFQCGQGRIVIDDFFVLADEGIQVHVVLSSGE